MFALLRRFADRATVAEVERLTTELREAQAALTVAETENRYLWSLAEREQARVERETAVIHRRRADAESVPTADELPAF